MSGIVLGGVFYQIADFYDACDRSRPPCHDEPSSGRGILKRSTLDSDSTLQPPWRVSHKNKPSTVVQGDLEEAVTYTLGNFPPDTRQTFLVGRWRRNSPGNSRGGGLTDGNGGEWQRGRRLCVEDGLAPGAGGAAEGGLVFRIVGVRKETNGILRKVRTGSGHAEVAMGHTKGTVAARADVRTHGCKGAGGAREA